MTVERTTERAIDPTIDQQLDLATIWTDIGTSIEQFVRRRIGDRHQADDVVADVMLRKIQALVAEQLRKQRR